MNWKILYWVVLGAECSTPIPSGFNTKDEAVAFAAEHGGDVYPVADVKVTEVTE